MANPSTYRTILNLSARLMAQPTVVAQTNLVMETVSSLVTGHATLWLNDTLHWPSQTEPPPSTSPSDLIHRSITSGEICLHPPGQAPGAVAIPLHIQDTLLGVLEVRRPEGPPFSSAEIELLDTLGIQTASALQATRQVTIERWHIEQLSLVRQVSAQITGVLSLEDLNHRVTNLILQTFDYYNVALFILEPGRDFLRMDGSASRSEVVQPTRDQAAPNLRVRLGQGIVGQAAQTGTEIVANDVSSEPRYHYVSLLPETRSEAALPLKIENQVLGVLDVQSDQVNAFDETNLLVLRALADNVAMAVEHARLYSDIRRRADQLAAVAEVSRAVTSILDLDILLEEVVSLIHTKFDYPYVYLFTIDPARGEIIYRAGTGPATPALEVEGLICTLDQTKGIVPWTACHGETVLNNNVIHDPRYRPTSLPPTDIQSELAVPLKFGDKVMGVLDVRSDRPNAFGDEDRFLLEALADNIATAIRNANLYNSERWRRQVAESLQQVAGLLTADVDLDQELDAILIELELTLPCDVAAIWLLRDGNLCLSAIRGQASQMCTGDLTPQGESWLYQALDADQPIIRTSQSPPEPLGIFLGFPPDYSAIAAPLRIGDQNLGLLTLIHHTAGRYGAESRTITSAFASHAAVAIENTRLYQEAQELAQISTVMLQVTEATRSASTLDELLATIVHLVPTLVNIDRCAILLWDDSTAVFVPAAAYGLTPAQQEVFRRWTITPGTEPALDDLRANKSLAFIYDVATDSRLSDLVVWDLGFESLLLLPLLAQGDVLGAMLIDCPMDWLKLDHRGTPIHDDRLIIIKGIVLQAAAAVENTRLREMQQEEAYVSAALLQVAQAVANLNRLDDILNTIVRITPILVGGDVCVIFTWDNEQSAFRAMANFGIPREMEALLFDRPYTPADFPLLETVRQSGQRAIHAHTALSNDGAIPPEIVAGLPTGDFLLLALPLAVKGDALGVMLLEEANSPQPVSEKRLEIITGIAHQAALAIQSDMLQQETAERERLERELQLAHNIQQTFMPAQPPHLPGWEIAFVWRAARQVAGDFYDFFELPNHKLGMVIADVADKGMPAALFMALTRTLMRAAALEESSPAAAIARVNDLLVPDAHAGMFVTAIYNVLSLKTGRLIYANAGHNLPLLFRAHTHEIESLLKGGMALGVLEGTRVQEHEVQLEPGDYVIFYTDGITEALALTNEEYGLDRLHATIQAINGGPAQAMLDAIDDSVATFIGENSPSDDRTLMILHRKAKRVGYERQKTA
ncbi:MAG TPA: GAF domain-containing protein [Chloroflexi bacterium]|nr:GAF domain-containing protein [Chloroflexota bacterium]